MIPYEYHDVMKRKCILKSVNHRQAFKFLLYTLEPRINGRTTCIPLVERTSVLIIFWRLFTCWLGTAHSWFISVAQKHSPGWFWINLLLIHCWFKLLWTFQFGHCGNAIISPTKSFCSAKFPPCPLIVAGIFLLCYILLKNLIFFFFCFKKKSFSAYFRESLDPELLFTLTTTQLYQIGLGKENEKLEVCTSYLLNFLRKESYDEKLEMLLT